VKDAHTSSQSYPSFRQPSARLLKAADFYEYQIHGCDTLCHVVGLERVCVCVCVCVCMFIGKVVLEGCTHEGARGVWLAVWAVWGCVFGCVCGCVCGCVWFMWFGVVDVSVGGWVGGCVLVVV
jgi:hypothetical protein